MVGTQTKYITLSCQMIVSSNKKTEISLIRSSSRAKHIQTSLVHAGEMRRKRLKYLTRISTSATRAAVKNDVEDAVHRAD